MYFTVAEVELVDVSRPQIVEYRGSTLLVYILT
jgi:hypothetical protein